MSSRGSSPNRRRAGNSNGNVTPPSTPLTTTIKPVVTGTRNSPHFRLSRIRHLLRGYSRARAIAPIATLACALTIEFILSEVMRRAGHYATQEKRRRLSNRHILQALQCEDLPWVPTLFPPRTTTIPAAGGGRIGANFDLSEGRTGKTKTGKGKKGRSKKSRKGKGGKR